MFRKSAKYIGGLDKERLDSRHRGEAKGIERVGEFEGERELIVMV